MTTTTLTVYHGPTMFHAYEQGTPLVKVGDFTFTGEVKPTDLLERAFAAMNDHPHGPDGAVTDAYYGKRLRSLCVGDVIVIGETAWTCASFGWDAVSIDPADVKQPGERIVHRSLPHIAAETGWTYDKNDPAWA